MIVVIEEFHCDSPSARISEESKYPPWLGGWMGESVSQSVSQGVAGRRSSSLAKQHPTT